MAALFSSGALEGSKTLMAAAMKEIEKATPEEPDADGLGRKDVAKVGERFSEPEMGEGIASLEAAEPELKENDAFMDKVAESGLAPEMDRAARMLQDDEKAEFAAKLLQATETEDPEAVGKLIMDTERELLRKERRQRRRQ